MSMADILILEDSDELERLAGLLAPESGRWQWHLQADPEAAMAQVAADAPDVLLARLDGSNDCLALFEQTRRLAPGTLRLGLCRTLDSSHLSRSIGMAHQLLPKPVDGDRLLATLRQALNMRMHLGGAGLQALVAGLSSLPSLSDSYHRIMALIERKDITLEDLGEVIAADVALTAKLLQLVNSAYFGLKVPISSPRQACVMLGLDAVRTLLVSIEVFRCLEPDQLPHTATRRQLYWLVGLALVRGRRARCAAIELGLSPHEAERCRLVAMLGDIGLMLLMTELPKRWQALLSAASGDWSESAEREVLGCSQVELGCYLLCLWGFDPALLHWHLNQRDPTKAQQPDRGLVAVYLARLCDGPLLPVTEDQAVAGTGQKQWDLAPLAELGLADRETDALLTKVMHG